MEKTDCIIFEEVGKKYGDFTALQNISFEIPKHSIVGLIGANGSGKTTLIECMLARSRDFTGKISIFGADNSQVEQTDFIFSFIPDTPILYEELTLREHLEFISKMYHSESRVDELIQVFELKEQLDKFPHELSKGNRQKLSICTALLREYQLLISDEPFTGLDPIQINTFKRILSALKDAEKTILVSTHLLNLIEDLCDYFVMLDHGEILQWGKVSNFLCESSKYKSLEDLYLSLTKNKEGKGDNKNE